MTTARFRVVAAAFSPRNVARRWEDAGELTRDAVHRRRRARVSLFRAFLRCDAYDWDRSPWDRPPGPPRRDRVLVIDLLRRDTDG